MKIATALGLLAALVGLLLTQQDEPQVTTSHKEVTSSQEESPRSTTPTSRERYSSVDDLVVKKSEYDYYYYSHPQNGQSPITMTFTYAEPFEEGYARVETRGGEFKIIDSKGDFVEDGQVPHGLGWDRVLKIRDRETGLSVYMGPDGNPLGKPGEDPPSVHFSGEMSHSIIRQGDSFFFGGNTYHQGSLSKRREVFLSSTPFEEISATTKIVDALETHVFYVVTKEGTSHYVKDSEVTAFLRDPDFVTTMEQPPAFRK